MEFLKHSQHLNGQRRITVGAVYHDNNTMTFGLAVCKPGDHFNKKVARNKAIGKARGTTTYAYSCTVPSPDRSNLGKFFTRIASELMANKNEEIELRTKADQFAI